MSTSFCICGIELLASSPVCGRCRSVRYCKKECQKRDWANHKARCYFLNAISKEILQETPLISRSVHQPSELGISFDVPVRIAFSADLGRHLVSKNTIPRSSIALVARRFALVPSDACFL